MKVPARRRGNLLMGTRDTTVSLSLNESPHPKVGKFGNRHAPELFLARLNESPLPKPGKYRCTAAPRQGQHCLNESPRRPKAGKSLARVTVGQRT